MTLIDRAYKLGPKSRPGYFRDAIRPVYRPWPLLDLRSMKAAPAGDADSRRLAR